MPRCRPRPLSLPPSRSLCSSPWLKVRVLIRAVLTHPWSADGWAEVKEPLPGLMAEERRLRRQGWLNSGRIE
jgi:hypothetical protein